MEQLTEILIPDIGDFETVEVIELLINVGDKVVVEDSLIALESDKAVMEVPATVAGEIVEVKLRLGDQVSAGDVIALVREAKTTDQQSATESESAPKVAQKPKSEPEPNSEVAQSDGAEPELPPAQVASAPPTVEQLAATPADAIYASPSVRVFARSLGVNIRYVRGSGIKGRILKKDIERFAANAKSGVGTSSDVTHTPPIDFSKFGEIETKKIIGIRKRVARNVKHAWLEVPHVTHFDEADITELDERRRALQKRLEQDGVKLTLMPFLVKALALTLAEFPKFSSSYDKSTDTLVIKKYCHIGIAVDTSDGLVVPVLHDADKKDIVAIAAELVDLSIRARTRKLRAADVQGGCISISNLGGYGGTAFTPLVNTPEVAVLGVARGGLKPVWDGKEFIPRLLLPLSLSYDHRVIDGADAARFIVRYVAWLGDSSAMTL